MKASLFATQFSPNSQAFNALVVNDVKHALSEDIGSGDLTAQLIPVTQSAIAALTLPAAAI